MSRKLLLLSYYFPPGNIIGAVRPYQIARYFSQRGWKVSVICCEDKAVPDNYHVDLAGIAVVRIPAHSFLSWLNAAYDGGGSISGRATSIFMRILRFAIRSLFLPEPFILVKKACLREADRLAENAKFDLVISSALPFTVHSVARNVAARYKVPWVADNRDLWAESPYRKMLFPRRWLDRIYEKSILSGANLVVGVTKAAVGYYRAAYGFGSSLVVMNGYSSAPGVVEGVPSQVAQLEIVYGGGLYGGLRDPSALLRAVAADTRLSSNVTIRFVGSETAPVMALQREYPNCRIVLEGRVSKTEVAERFSKASVLLVILGGGAFELGVLPGKFFEYLGYGKPVLALAAENSELACLVNGYKVGFASDQPEKITEYLLNLLNGESPLNIAPPEELSIKAQLDKLYDHAVQLTSETRP